MIDFAAFFRRFKRNAAKAAKPKQTWHGSYLSEDEIVVDILRRTKADPDALSRWLDPVSWRLPVDKHGKLTADAPKHAGCMMFAGMGIRNWYGLWHPENPNSIPLNDGNIVFVENPDDLSARIISRVKLALREWVRK